MTSSKAAPQMNIEILAATPEQQPILANLLELYVHDFSEFLNLRLGADGRFGYPQLPLYWTAADRHPFLITADGDPAGFAFVRKGSQISGDPNVWDMSEFFIVRGCRRHRMGMMVAYRIWQKFPGKWEVRVINRNRDAKEFWARAVAEFAGGTVDPVSYEKNGEGWTLFSFESGGQS
jgi:predicted acetyltransferase